MEVLRADEVEAIDCHVHIPDERPGRATPERLKFQARYFQNEGDRPTTVEGLAADYRGRKMRAVLLNVTDATVSGEVGLPNDAVAEAVDRYPDVFSGFCVIDPWQGKLAEKEVRRSKEMGLVGIGELNPARQHFYPNDRRFYPIWQTASDLGMPVLFHTGMAGAGAGAPGGLGIKLKYAQPLLLDEVAADFPELRIIAAHPSWPWQAESLAMARHKGNVFLDLSGWAPKYWSDELVRYVNSVLPDKAMFGSDTIRVDRWLAEFEALPMKPEVREKILRTNAMKFFELGVGR